MTTVMAMKKKQNKK